MRWSFHILSARPPRASSKGLICLNPKVARRVTRGITHCDTIVDTRNIHTYKHMAETIGSVCFWSRFVLQLVVKGLGILAQLIYAALVMDIIV